jgi:hypothetical protein
MNILVSVLVMVSSSTQAGCRATNGHACERACERPHFQGRDHSVLSTAATGLTPARIIALTVASAGHEGLLNNWLRRVRAVSDVPIRVALYDRNATRSCTGGGSCRAAFEARIIRLSGTASATPEPREGWRSWDLEVAARCVAW